MDFAEDEASGRVHNPRWIKLGDMVVRSNGISPCLLATQLPY